MKAKRMFGAVEVVFDLAYLTTAAGFAIYYLSNPGREGYLLFGLMTLVLAAGDSFHLVPRVLSIVKREEETYRVALGLGKMVTSVGMTIFYLFLWQIGVWASGNRITALLTVLIWIFAALRIGLCLLPQNRWRTEDCSETWNRLRNLPFLAMGLMVAGIYFWGRRESGFPYMWIAVLLSFGFYISVVLFAKKNPKIGMLMLPKTCMYLWMIGMGISGCG